MRLFKKQDIQVTIFGAALALERNPEAARAIADAGYDICCDGWRWIGYHLAYCYIWQNHGRFLWS